ncbi:PREDICTED: uncharacterized protein LOC104612746 [Nelumbo nucifera]|uniref:Uncharacterized protein LOC104612746 n=1 Tax=Nelumbo nucifera TaxID=4432 RepID=A0A1U8BB97_NELNU|nr:PREDICTED: uncharacterized protein LOC104612746 [Nelumbo nucifera]
MPKDFKVPPLNKYYRSFDPNDGVGSFQSQMHLVGADEACMCVAFSTTFRGVVRTRYKNLAPDSTKSWAQFAELFTTHFITIKKCPKSQESPLNVVQRERESIRSYIKCFNDICQQIPDLDPTVRLTATKKGITHKEFNWNVAANKPKVITEFLKLADQFINTKEKINQKTDNPLAEKRKREDEGMSNNGQKRKKKSPRRDRRAYPPRVPEELHHARGEKAGRPIGDRQDDQRRNAPETSRQNEYPPRQLPEERPVRGVINTITGGSIIARCTSTARRTSVRKLKNEGENPPKRPRLEEPIYFTKDGAHGIQYPHDDALVVKLRINDFEVKHILVDSGSSADILFKEAFDKLQLQHSNLKAADTPLIGFCGEEVRPLGRDTVPAEAETRYPEIEKLAYALVIATRKLHPYLQAHTIVVLTNRPLRQILLKPEVSGRLMKWSIELSEYDIRFEPRPTIKAQALANFVAECTFDAPTPDLTKLTHMSKASTSAALDPVNVIPT